MSTPQPILMSDPMILATLAGYKSETRRIWSERYAKVERGHLLWVREAWRCREIRLGGEALVQYRADKAERWVSLPRDHGLTISPDKHRDAPWASSMFMPKAFSRATLKVDRVERQRLHAITIVDCMHEGLRGPDLIGQYRRLWDSLHGDPPSRWAVNPEVAVVVFEVLQRNVAELAKRRVAA